MERLFLFFSCILFAQSDGARILAVFPGPFISHQLVFRPLTQELAKRGHELVIITPMPAFNDDNRPKNITEIDVQEISFKHRVKFAKRVTGRHSDRDEQFLNYFKILADIFEDQIRSDGVQKLINDKNQKFDLVIVEGCVKPSLVMSHVFKAPVVILSSLGSLGLYTDFLGTPKHPILYPYLYSQKLNDLNFWDRLYEIYMEYYFDGVNAKEEANENEMLKRNFGKDVPNLSELKKNVRLVMMTLHHWWENNRPVPANLVYLGGLHLASNSTGSMSKELKAYLDSSKRGVIYVSFGSLVATSMLPKYITDTIIGVLSRVPYDVLLKWDTDLPCGASCSNIKVMKWFPQAEVLKHPNVKLFIMQGGLQSTDEAIVGGIPLIGMPALGDQWYNTEQYERFHIGKKVSMDGITDKKLTDAIHEVINDDSYRKNMESLREMLHDQPRRSLELAVWWIERVLHNDDPLYLNAPASNTSWSLEFLQLDVLAFVFGCLLLMVAFVCALVYKIVCVVKRSFVKVKGD